MLSYSQLTLESLLETSLKLKILHLSEVNMSSEKDFFLHNKSVLLKSLLKLVYTLRLKKVFSGKFTNRVSINYFKKLLHGSNMEKFADLQVNKAFLDSNYVLTLGINNLYENFELISNK